VSRAFIFTLDAVLALVPVMILVGSLSTLTAAPSLYLQGHVLGTERVAQDLLRTLELTGDIRSLNATDLNTTLYDIVPDRLNFSYQVEDLDSEDVLINITRGESTNTSTILVTRRVATSGSVVKNLSVTPSLLTKSLPETQNEADALNALLFASVGVSPIVFTDYPTLPQWSEIAEVTVKLGNYSTYWGSGNQTLEYLLDQLILRANTQGKATAVTGLNQVKTLLDNSSRGSLTYNVTLLLGNYNSGYENLSISATDILYGAFQSAGQGLSSSDRVSNITSSDGNYRLIVSVTTTTLPKTYVVFQGSLITSEVAEATVEVWNKVVPPNKFVHYNTLEYETLQPACFNLTTLALYSLTAGTVVAGIDSTTASACGSPGQINVTLTNVTTGEILTATITENARSLAPTLFTGIPMAEEERIFTDTLSNTTFATIYNASLQNAGSELDGILREFPLTRVDLSVGVDVEKRGQVNVDSVLYGVSQYLITLHLWGD
jgi:hypothetical protein